jgi:hypothetical protein
MMRQPFRGSLTSVTDDEHEMIRVIGRSPNSLEPLDAAPQGVAFPDEIPASNPYAPQRLSSDYR